MLCIDPALLSKLELAVLRMHRPRAYGALAITATLWDCDAVLTPEGAELWHDPDMLSLEWCLLQAGLHGMVRSTHSEVRTRLGSRRE